MRTSERRMLGALLTCVLAGTQIGGCGSGGGGGDGTSSGAQATSTLTFTESGSVSLGAGTFGGIDYDGSQISVTFGRNNHLFLRRYDLSLNQLGSEAQLTTNADTQAAPTGTGQVTDHKLITTASAHYITFSRIGDDDLFLMRYDANWNRLGAIETLVLDSTNSKCNDMFMTTNGSTIYVGRFAPSNLTGYSTAGHFVSRRNLDLTLAAADVTAINPSHVNGASAIWNGSQFVLFTSNGAGGQPHDLLKIVYDTSFTMVSNATLFTSSDNETFPTGSAYDSVRGRHYVAYVKGPDGSVGIVDNGALILKVFDSSWQELGSTTIVSSGGNRAHLALVGSDLYCVYDAGTSIFVKKYTVSSNNPVSWAVESGIRISSATSSSTQRLANGTFRTYLAGITTATSTDGLAWSSSTSVGLTGPGGKFLRNPATLQQSDGTYLMIYKGVTNNTDMRFYRATSSDGITFTKTNGVLTAGAVMLPEADENNFISVPELIRVNSTTIRIYFVAFGDHVESAISTDEGFTWVREGNISISGLLAGQLVVDPDIVRLADGTYRLFFATPPDGVSSGNMRIKSAVSTDGRSFTLESGERVGVETSTQIRLDPDVVPLPGNMYRMYFGEAPDSNTTYHLRSAVSP